MKSENTIKLSACAFGVAIGFTWGLGMLVLAYLSMFNGFGSSFVDLFATVYIGYKATVLGGLIGFFWGFLDGIVIGVIIGLVYNFVRCHCPCPMCICKCKKAEKK